VLLICGEVDQLVPIKVGEALRDLFPNRTWITYPEIGHVAMDENTVQFNKDLLEFIADKPA
jgi:pimeloyl-ACP methyl ester carboxylesterase